MKVLIPPAQPQQKARKPRDSNHPQSQTYRTGSRIGINDFRRVNRSHCIALTCQEAQGLTNQSKDSLISYLHRHELALQRIELPL